MTPPKLRGIIAYFHVLRMFAATPADPHRFGVYRQINAVKRPETPLRAGAAPPIPGSNQRFYVATYADPAEAGAPD